MSVSRRTFLRGAAATLAAGPILARAQPIDPVRLFQHGVASGDPLADRVIIWTRVTAPLTRSAIGPIGVEWMVATDERLDVVVARGSVLAAPDRDFTVKVDAAGLESGRTYFYGFEAGGQRSPVGRTRTLAPRGTGRVRLAVVSCSNYGAGYFNVYRCIGQRDDLDLVMHLGDYIYETAVGSLGSGAGAGRIAQSPTIAATLDEYRLRYAAYRSDADLQHAHARHPFVAVWDDHEIIDNAWSGGAPGHDTRTLGPWRPRQAAAYRAYLEWMPIRESTQSGTRLYRSFRLGDMADVVMLDTRGLRDRQLPPADVARMDGGRSLLGDAQERWLFDRLRNSKRDGTRWRLLGQQIMFSSLNPPGTPPGNPDMWEGYPAARRRVLDFLADERLTNVAILAGDLHSSWAFDVPLDPWSRSRDGARPLAVEIVAPAISSPPLFADAVLRDRMADVPSRVPHLKLLDGDHNGYVLLELTRESMHADWFFVPTVAERTDQEARHAGFVCESGASRLIPA
jgi:alkaline phosphatase D